jgi:hypothetical protein
LFESARCERIGVVDDHLEHHARGHFCTRRPHRQPAFASRKHGALAFTPTLECMTLEAERVQK